MPLRSIVLGLALIFTFGLSSPARGEDGPEAAASSEKQASLYNQWMEKAGEGIQGIYTGGFHIYWKDGLHLDSWKKNLKFTINGRIEIDAGYIGADDELDAAFPNLAGGDVNLRTFQVAMACKIRDAADLKLTFDFANAREIKDNWIKFKKIPFVGHFTFGYMKEPISLEYMTGGKNITFMERSLPVLAFAPGRDFGFARRATALDKRLTWTVGGFWVTGSYSDVGDANDRLSESFGAAITGRISYLPRHADEGRTLLHVGLSYTHQFRDESRDDSQLKASALPESYLTDDTLVGTGKIPTGGIDLVGLEIASVFGPSSLQGEFFQSFVNSDSAGNPRFWGFYVCGSHFLTGEHRNYNRDAGVFSHVIPNQGFHPMKGQWGAWEAAFRFSFVDLNSGDIRGGKEANFTAGLNWYWDSKLRIMFNYIHARVSDRAEPSVDLGRANIIQTRLQVLF